MEELTFDLQRFDDEETPEPTETPEIPTSNDLLITAGGTYNVAPDYAGIITVDTSEPVVLVGTGTATLTGAQIVTGSAAANLTIDGLNIANINASPLKFGAGGGTLTLLGNNSLVTSNDYTAALNIGGGLTIVGTGSLTAIATGYGAGIGTDYGATTPANLMIAGGIITAQSNYGAGIGSGLAASIGNVEITGGVINATSTTGAGIGTGASSGNSNANTPNPNAPGARPMNPNNAGAVNINGGVVSATSRDGAGIGSGFDGSIGNISIGGTANVNASSTGMGAGIGSGSTFGNAASAGNITVNGSANVVAVSASNGAGIGSGSAQYTGSNSAGNVSIEGDATVSATSLRNGVGIGAGSADESATNSIGTINLRGDPSTTAKSMVVIDNSDTTREITINGTALSGSRLVFVDGENSNPPIPATDTTTAATATDTVTVNNITIGENVTGATSVGKVDGSDDYIYIGGVGVISDYEGVTYGEDGESGAKIRYATDFISFTFDGNTLIMNSSTGGLIVQNCKDKLISIADPLGNTTAYVYSPNANGVIYGNLFSQPEVIWGSDWGADIPIAGNAGSTLWGGGGAFDDTLQGGAGHDEYIYLDGSGNDVIFNYGSEDLIKVNGILNGVNLFGNFALNFSNGSLTVADSWDRIITVADAMGNVMGQAFYASSSGVVDGRGLFGKEVLVGGTFGSNLIIAGDGGSSLWANFGGVNTLVGGGGADEFIYTPGSGVVFVQNANAFDTVNLYGVTGDQIAGAAVTSTDTTITFKDGGALNVQGTGATYKFGGATYVADNQTGTFRQV